jgi:hypothetical protein
MPTQLHQTQNYNASEFMPLEDALSAPVQKPT